MAAKQQRQHSTQPSTQPPTNITTTTVTADSLHPSPALYVSSGNDNVVKPTETGTRIQTPSYIGAGVLAQNSVPEREAPIIEAPYKLPPPPTAAESNKLPSTQKKISSGYKLSIETDEGNEAPDSTTNTIRSSSQPVLHINPRTRSGSQGKPFKNSKDSNHNNNYRNRSRTSSGDFIQVGLDNIQPIVQLSPSSMEKAIASTTFELHLNSTRNSPTKYGGGGHNKNSIAAKSNTLQQRQPPPISQSKQPVVIQPHDVVPASSAHPNNNGQSTVGTLFSNLKSSPPKNSSANNSSNKKTGVGGYKISYDI